MLAAAASTSLFSPPTANRRRAQKKGIYILDSPNLISNDLLNGISNLVSIEDFYGGDLLTNHIKNQIPLLRFQRDASVIGTVGSFWLRANVKCSAEIVTASAAAYDWQSGHLGGKFVFALLNEKIVNLICECWQNTGK